MWRCFLVLLVLLFLPMGTAATAATEGEGALLIAVSTNHVRVDTGFKGGEITIFGVKHAPGEIAVEIIGPQRTTIVRRKSRVLGVWANTDSRTFKAFPQFYAYALSPGAREQNHWVGTDAILIPPESPEDRAFRDALIRYKRERGLLPEGPIRLTYLSADTFVVRFALPPDAPVGRYAVRAVLRRDGQKLGEFQDAFTLDHMGLAGMARTFSREQPWAYGLICVIMATLAGWGMSVISIRR
ncbi:MAG TPA: hypothetical protein DDX54_04255 [Rhodospirillaceae bacterium]|jgi:uncharacterized protein (TIGR02186 family)|nr:TIGR02186 family protein [Alphaproteobacteria bacterium]HBH26596.1 hypothetical protein [Rhodospirillaceae bacterium]